MSTRPILKRQGVMLAYPLDEGKLRRLGDTFLLQPKLNGERCRTEWFQGEPFLMSSYANQFPHLKLIKHEIFLFAEAFGVEAEFDGELYVHGWPRERIDAAVRCPVNYNPDNADLEYHIFDLVGDAIQSWRSSMLLSFFKKYDFKYLKLVPTVLANKDTWEEGANEYLDKGYEGAVLRALENTYDPKRSVKMLKFKPTESDRYLIVGVQEAISQEGEPKGMVGSFLVKDSDGNSFSVSAGKLTHAKREHYWQVRQALIGRYLLTKHERLKTTHGVPVCAVGVEVI